MYNTEITIKSYLFVILFAGRKMSTPKKLLFLSIIPLLLASKCKERKKQEDTEEQIIEVAQPEAIMQIVGIDPDKFDPGIPFNASITGTGFEEGATVMVGLDVVPETSFVSSNSLSISVPSMEPGTYDVFVTNPDGETKTGYSLLTIRELEPELPAECREMVVYFELDKSILKDESQSLLLSKASCFEIEGIQVRVEGHCDERGTTEYNIVLGERRAASVQQYLIAQGVSEAVIEPISYGEEKPAVLESNEDAWAKNRRAVIIVSD
jgi:peptidoglycan-associated lipoprotein